MQRATDLATFRSAPVGRWTSGAGWIHYCAHETLFGVVLFDRPSRSDVASLVASLRIELANEVAAHQSLVDAHRLSGVDAAAFDELHRYVREEHDRLSTQVGRLALVRPAGMEGAVVAGFYGVLEPPYPVEVFDSAEAALEWLDEDPSLSDVLAKVVAEASGADPLLVALRSGLAAELDLSPADASRRLGVSERTLQRRLSALDTTFSREVILARLGEAKRRMLDTDEPLTSIALDVGFRSPAHFSSVFRREEGLSPSAWRKQSK